jgi:hypothetical protein
MYGHLTIRKCYNRKGLAKWFRDNLSNISLIKAFQMTDSLPFNDSDFWFDAFNILKALEGVAEYSWKEDDDIIKYGSACVPSVFPSLTEKQENYMKAVEWYASLSLEDKEKIDILVNASHPYG